MNSNLFPPNFQKDVFAALEKRIAAETAYSKKGKHKSLIAFINGYEPIISNKFRIIGAFIGALFMFFVYGFLKSFLFKFSGGNIFDNVFFTYGKPNGKISWYETLPAVFSLVLVLISGSLIGAFIGKEIFCSLKTKKESPVASLSILTYDDFSEVSNFLRESLSFISDFGYWRVVEREETKKNISNPENLSIQCLFGETVISIFPISEKQLAFTSEAVGLILPEKIYFQSSRAAIIIGEAIRMYKKYLDSPKNQENNGNNEDNEDTTLATISKFQKQESISSQIGIALLFSPFFLVLGILSSYFLEPNFTDYFAKKDYNSFYIKRVKDTEFLKAEYLKATNTGDNATTIKRVRDDVLPILEEISQNSNNYNPKSPEVREIHNLLLSSLEYRHNGLLNLICELYGISVEQPSRKILNDADVLMQEYIDKMG